MTSVDRINDIDPIGRLKGGGYRRFAWTREDAALREWFEAVATELGLQVTLDRAGNQWAWWGDPDADGPGVVTGSHLDSVPRGGAFDGPLGVAAAFGAIETLRLLGREPARPIGVVNFADEEGARFGVACAGSRILTGALDPSRACALRDADGTTLAEAAGPISHSFGRDDETLRRVGSFVELHIEQGKHLVNLGAPVGVGTAIWPHGRWRFDFAGTANHAGTTALADRQDPMIAYARAVVAARKQAERYGTLATFGKVVVEPNGVNAIPSKVTGWLDARAEDESALLGMVAELARAAAVAGAAISEESYTAATGFDDALIHQVARAVHPEDGGVNVPLLGTGAGHDAGILAAAGIPAAMIFVRNPTGVSHSPAERAEFEDCLAGLHALTRTVGLLSGLLP